MPFDNVYSDRYNGKDTESQIVLGGPVDPNVKHSMPFDDVYSDKYAHKDTESQIQF